jgi:hypothetical protein
MDMENTVRCWRDISKNPLVAGVAPHCNGWEVSGYVGYQSGPNMLAIYGNNFALGGTRTLPTGTTATITGQSPSVCSTNPCTLGVGSTDFLGTPDVSLQPTVIGELRGSGGHNFANGKAFGLPLLGTNATYHFGYLPGPAFFDADISATPKSLITATFRFVSPALTSRITLLSASRVSIPLPIL